MKKTLFAILPFIFLFFLCAYLYYFYFFQGPYNDTWAYTNIINIFHTRGELKTYEIFPSTLPYIKDFPAPIIRRSPFFSFFTSLLTSKTTKPLHLSFLSFTWFSLSFLLFLWIIVKSNFTLTSKMLLILFLFNPLTWELAFSGVIEPLFMLLINILFLLFYSYIFQSSTLSLVGINLTLFLMFLLRPHTIFIWIGLFCYFLILKRKKEVLALVFTLITFLTLSHFLQPYPSYAAYFLIDQVGTFKNHNFERTLSPPPIVKTILNYPWKFLKKIIKNLWNLIYTFSLQAPLFFLLTLTLIFDFLKRKNIHSPRGAIIFLFIITFFLYVVFSLFFVVRFRYFWPYFLVLLAIYIIYLENQLSFKRKKIFFPFIILLIFQLSQFNWNYFNFPHEYYKVREKLFSKWKPKISKISPQGIITDIPWCGASILQLPSIWIPAKIEDIFYIQKKFQINYLLITGLWIEKEKMIENYPFYKLKLVGVKNYTYYGRKYTSYLYEISRRKKDGKGKGSYQ